MYFTFTSLVIHNIIPVGTRFYYKKMTGGLGSDGMVLCKISVF